MTVPCVDNCAGMGQRHGGRLRQALSTGLHAGKCCVGSLGSPGRVMLCGVAAEGGQDRTLGACRGRACV